MNEMTHRYLSRIGVFYPQDRRGMNGHNYSCSQFRLKEITAMLGYLRHPAEHSASSGGAKTNKNARPDCFQLSYQPRAASGYFATVRLLVKAPFAAG
jgi:hypothetical protein